MPDSPQTLAQALHAFQAEAPALQRDSINPAFRSKYLSLESLMEQVLPLLNKHGLFVVQEPRFIYHEGAEPLPILATTLGHAASGEMRESSMLLLPAKRDPQAQGSAITYARRYSLMAALGLVADEDDDGNAATKPAPARKPAAKITQAQVAELRAIVSEGSIPSAVARDAVRAAGGVSKVEDLPAAKFAAVRDALKAAA